MSLLSVGFLVLLLALSLLGLGVLRNGNAMLTVVIVVALIAIQLTVIWVLFAAAKAITHHRRWGYVVGLLMTAPSAVGGIMATRVQPDVADLEWVQVTMWFGIAYYGILALLSLAALVASFTRRDVTSGGDMESASTR